MEKSLLCWHWTRMGQNQFTIPHTKQLLGMGSPSCCRASQQKPAFRKELKKTDDFGTILVPERMNKMNQKERKN